MQTGNKKNILKTLYINNLYDYLYMKNSKVYFIDFHATPKMNILKKLEYLTETAGIYQIDFTKKITAVKIHFGEPGNLSYIRPNYAAVLVKMIKEKQGLPFLTDANTLYKGRRSNAIDHLQCAMENGFNPLTLGCNVIIADGLKGTEYREIEINQKNVKKAKIATAIADADILISLNHFKGHEMTGFGGALKNLGMGCGSIGGKHEMHSGSQPFINVEKCTGCEVCVNHCEYDAIHMNAENIAEIDYRNCTGCGQCIAVCMYDAPQAQSNAEDLQEKMMEYVLAAINEKPSFHINFIMDVSPHCDCWHYNDVPVVPDIGIMASFDPVAIDRASADLINKAPVFQNSIIGKKDTKGKDYFKTIHPNTDWTLGLNYAEKLGLGKQAYDLVEL
jgi:hypothetical protein